ncbi:MAG: hypothetical protein LBL79_03915 [Prevotella sp.]|jgi:hypothetical protein|nr:hypothetical protein [Prevotella sp.]
MFEPIIEKINRYNEAWRKKHAPVITDRMIRYKLTSAHFDGVVDITEFVTNWNDLDQKIVRQDLTATSKDITVPLEVNRSAAELLKAIYDEYGFFGNVNVSIYRRDRITNDYTMVMSMDLYFGSYKKTDNGVSFEANQGSLKDYVNGAKTTKFDVPVSEIADSRPFHYGRIENYPCQIDYIMAETKYKRLQYVITPTINLNRYDIDPLANIQDARSQIYMNHPYPPVITTYLLKASQDLQFNLVIDFEFYSTSEVFGTIFEIVKVSNDTESVIWTSEVSKSSTIHVDQNLDVSLNAEDRLYVRFQNMGMGNPDISITKFNKFRISHKM